jgi:hypothetical protein
MPYLHARISEARLLLDFSRIVQHFDLTHLY